MKKKLLITNIIVIISVIFSINVFSSEEIKWVGSFKKSIEIAKKTKKIRMIDFYTTWCYWCKVLDEKTYSDEKVIKLSRDFINLKINAETETGSELASKYNVRGFPCIVFLDYNGELVGTISGYKPPDAFYDYMKMLMDNHLSYNKTSEAYNKNPNDLESGLAFSEQLFKRGLNKRGVEILEKISESSKIEKEEKQKIYLRLMEIFINELNINKAKKYLEKIDSERLENKEMINFYNGLIYFLTQDYENASIYFKKLIKDYKESKKIKEYYILYSLVLLSQKNYKESYKVLKSLKKSFDIDEKTPIKILNGRATVNISELLTDIENNIKEKK